MPVYFLTARFPWRLVNDNWDSPPKEPPSAHEKHGHVFYQTDSQIVAERLVEVFRSGLPAAAAPNPNATWPERYLILGAGCEKGGSPFAVFEIVNGADLSEVQRVQYKSAVAALAAACASGITLDMDRADDRRRALLWAQYGRAHELEPLIRDELDVAHGKAKGFYLWWTWWDVCPQEPTANLKERTYFYRADTEDAAASLCRAFGQEHGIDIRFGYTASEALDIDEIILANHSIEKYRRGEYTGEDAHLFADARQWEYSLPAGPRKPLPQKAEGDDATHGQRGSTAAKEEDDVPSMNIRNAAWLVDTTNSLLEFVHVHREQLLDDKELSTLDSLGNKMNSLAVALDLTTPDRPVYYSYRAELARGIGPDIVNPTWPGGFTDRGDRSGFFVKPTSDWLKRIHDLRDKAKTLSAPEAHNEVPLADQSTPETEYFLWLTIEHPPHEICFYSLKDSKEAQLAGRLCRLFTMKYSDADPYVPEYQNPVFDYRAAADLDPNRAFLIRDEIERFRQRNDWAAKATLTAFSSVSDLRLARQELGSYCYKQAAIWEKELRDEARPPQSQHLAEAGAADTQGAAKGAIASSSGPTRTAKGQSSRKEATDHNDELRAYEEARWKELEAAFHRGEVDPGHANQSILWWMLGPKQYAIARLQGYPSEEEIGHRFSLSLETMARAAESHGLNSAQIAKADHVLSKYGREALKILSAQGKEMDALAPCILHVFPPGKGPNPQERAQFERGWEVIGRLNAINGQQLMAAAAREGQQAQEGPQAFTGTVPDASSRMRLGPNPPVTCEEKTYRYLLEHGHRDNVSCREIAAKIHYSRSRIVQTKAWKGYDKRRKREAEERRKKLQGNQGMDDRFPDEQ